MIKAKHLSLICALVVGVASTARGATTQQRAAWDAALKGSNVKEAFEALFELQSMASDDPAIIPMLIDAMTRTEEATGGDVPIKIGATACATLGRMTQYPIFPDISCLNVSLPEAKKVWSSWYQPRATWAIARMRTDAADKRQRLLRSKRPDEALRGVVAAMAFANEPDDVKKTIKRFAGKLRATAVRSGKDRVVVTLRNAGKAASIYAIGPSSLCTYNESTPSEPAPGRAEVTIPPSCPLVSPSFSTFEYTKLLLPGKARSFDLEGRGNAVLITEELRDQRFLVPVLK